MSHFELDRAELARFTGMSGPIGEDLERRLRTLKTRARMSAGKDTGWLIARMRHSRYSVVDGLEGKVGSEAPYSLLHHTGTRPHVIRPRNAKALRFRVGTRIVYARSVNHPGTRPNPYLTRWLKEAAR